MGGMISKKPVATQKLSAECLTSAAGAALDHQNPRSHPVVMSMTGLRLLSSISLPFQITVSGLWPIHPNWHVCTRVANDRRTRMCVSFYYVSLQPLSRSLISVVLRVLAALCRLRMIKGCAASVTSFVFCDNLLCRCRI